MSGHDIIVVGARRRKCLTGGNLPPDLPAAIFVVLHIPAHSTSVLPRILNRSQKNQGASLQAEHAQEGARRLCTGGFTWHHQISTYWSKRLHPFGARPKENSHRPAVDPLFRTAARVYGRHVVGVVLSALDDGTAGLAALKKQGGCSDLRRLIPECPRARSRT